LLSEGRWRQSCACHTGQNVRPVSRTFLRIKDNYLFYKKKKKLSKSVEEQDKVVTIIEPCDNQLAKLNCGHGLHKIFGTPNTGAILLSVMDFQVAPHLSSPGQE
jgi:hypothetical protein